MISITFRWLSLFYIIWISMGLQCSVPEKAPLNILFIMTDDHAAHAISAYGSQINNTPNLDRIADAGMRFNHTYCTNSICAPSRAVILTGKYSHLNGVLDNRQAFDGSQQTFPKLMQNAGYQTAMIGKWHLKSPPIGFDYYHVLPGQGDYYNPVMIENGERKKHEGYVTDLITDFSLDWLKNRDEHKPFLMMLQHKAPHRNWQPGPDHLTTYDDVEIPMPESLFDTYETKSPASREQTMTIKNHLTLSRDLKLHEIENEIPGWLKKLNSEQLENWINAYHPKNEVFLENQESMSDQDIIKWKYQRYIKDYLRTIASVDDNVGRVLDYLESQNLMQNTVIIYTSDQGFYLGDRGWFDKRFMYEESYKMPLLVAHPSFENGVSDALVMNVDFAPTILDLVGIPVPDDMQGESFAPILKSGLKPDAWREATYYHYFEYPGPHSVKRHYGIRTEYYKLIHYYFDIDAWELFDLREDPAERINEYANPAYQTIIDTLKRKLVDLQSYYDDNPEEFMLIDPQRELRHLGIGKSYQLVSAPSEKYQFRQHTVLTDGVYNAYNRYSSVKYKDWLGYQTTAEVILDLGGVRDISRIAVHSYQDLDSWIHYPSSVRFYYSEDQQIFHEVDQSGRKNLSSRFGTEMISAHGLTVKGRFVKFEIEPVTIIPPGLPGEGENSWLFLDEIVVE